MKVALCLSGQPRFFRQGFEYFKNALDGIDTDYFLHSWYDQSEIGKDLSHAAPEGKNPIGWSVMDDTDNKLLDLFSPKRYLIEKQKKFQPKYDFQSRSQTWQDPEVFMSMLYSRKKVGELLSEYVKETGAKYDWVICTRTDIAIQIPIMEEFEHANAQQDYLSAHVPGKEWNKDLINPAIIASSLENMVYWSGLYDYYEDYWLEGVTYCDHRMCYHHLEKTNKNLKSFLVPQGIGWSYIRANGLRIC